MKHEQLRIAGTAATLVAALLIPAPIALADQAEKTPVIQVGAPVTPFVFDGDVRDLPQAPAWKPGDPIKEIPRRYYPRPGSYVEPDYEPGIDPLVGIQQSAPVYRGSGSFTTPTRNFAGQGFTGVSPPDTVGDVGLDHYVQMVNTGGGTDVRIWDKAEPTPNLITTFRLDNLGSGNCSFGFGDPVVLYDRLADRWMLSEFSSAGNDLCVYISQTPDPVSGGWYAYNFVPLTFPDYPKYGVWPTDANDGPGSYVVTANDGGGTRGIYVMERGPMLNGEAAGWQTTDIPTLSGFSFQTATPADLDGPVPPPDGAPAIIMRHRDTENHGGPAAPGDLLEMWTFDVDWVTPGNSVLTAETSIDIAEIDSSLCGLTAFACFPQPGTGTTLDPLREVIMFRLQYMNHDDHETLVGNLVTDVDGANLGGLRWFELRGGHGNWTVHQEGTYSIDSDSRWMGASAMDQSGNIAIGYNVSSDTTFPSLRYTGRMSDDPPGMMTQPESVIHDGTASSGTNRYGDYASMNLDPVDDCTFWFTGEDNTSSSWRTQVASFKFDACGCLLFPDPLTPSTIDNGDNQIDITWDDSELETVVEYLVKRSRNPGGPYETIAVVPDDSPGVGNGPGYLFEDLTVSGTITYYYVVVASDGAACKSDSSNESSATATGACTLAPVFDGLQSVSGPDLLVCTLDLAWSAASPECGGPETYNIYRSTTPGFTPGAGTLLAAGVNNVVFSDLNSLVDGADLLLHRACGRSGQRRGGQEPRRAVGSAVLELGAVYDRQQLSGESVRQRRAGRTADRLRRQRPHAGGEPDRRNRTVHLPVDPGRRPDSGRRRIDVRADRRRYVPVQLSRPGFRLLGHGDGRPADGDRHAGCAGVCRRGLGDRPADRQLQPERSVESGGLGLPGAGGIFRLPRHESGGRSGTGESRRLGADRDELRRHGRAGGGGRLPLPGAGARVFDVQVRLQHRREIGRADGAGHRIELRARRGFRGSGELRRLDGLDRSGTSPLR